MRNKAKAPATVPKSLIRYLSIVMALIDTVSRGSIHHLQPPSIALI